MDDKRNIITAMLLIGLILFGWPMLAQKFFPQPKQTNKTVVSAPATPGVASPEASVSSTAAPTKAVAIGDALNSSTRILIETPKLKGSINLEGGKIDDLVLLAHRTELAKDSPPVRLFAPLGTKDAYYARFGWVGAGIAVPDDKTVWTSSGAKLTPTTPVTLSWTNAAAQKFDIILSIDKDYLITADQQFTNNSTAAVQISTFGLVNRKSKSLDPNQWNIHVGPMGVFNQAANYDVNYEYLDGASPGFFSKLFGTSAVSGKNSFSSTGGWVGFTDKYWLAAIIPNQDTAFKAQMVSGNGGYQASAIPTKMTNVVAGGTTKQVSRVFAGAKEVLVLNDYTDRLYIQKLDFAIDWGWFAIIEKAFFKVLHFLFGYFGNFGYAIIGLTFIVRLFMFPIAQRQFASMAQMRVVQPKMKAVQERWKDDKPRQQQEIMKLYKEEKVNPLAGCLPIFLQMPIFFGLYKLLTLSIEMRHQPFIGWLKDLSVPDPSTSLLFQSIGIPLPAFLAIGILPILLGVTMWGMQKLNPQPMDDVQKQVFAIMPWMMMFMFASLASGLQLYYVVSNILTILQQKWLYSRHPILKQQAAKDGADKVAAKAAT